jgi:integrase/recombinase XerD
MPETITISTVITTVFSNTDRLALGGFLAGYGGQTRDAYSLDLRQWAAWCTSHGLRLLDARRADIEAFGRALETAGRAPATVSRRLCTVAGFYRYAVEEELLDHSPAVHVRRPRLDYESHAVGLDRNEIGTLLVAAGLGGPAEHALISLLAAGLQTCGADIEALALERGHRTLPCYARAARWSPSRSPPARPGRSTWPSASAARAPSSSAATVAVSTGTPPPASSTG